MSIKNPDNNKSKRPSAAQGDAKRSSAKSTADGPSAAGNRDEASPHTAKQDGVEALASAMPYNVNKAGEHKTLKVGDHINLTKVKVGDSVTIRQTEAIAISVEKP